MFPNETTRQSVLCVDVNSESRSLFSQLVNDYDVVFAQNACDALRNANSRAFHAYLLDYWLPDWSGPSLCRELRKADPHVPIIFCTGAARDADRARALRAGANAYLCKPVDSDVLRGKLRAFLALARTESLHAKIEEERVIQEELDRRLADIRARVDTASRLLASSIERTARAKAFRAFMGARGTRADFDNWWPTVFATVRANGDDRGTQAAA